METAVVLDFLTELKSNNNREWFALNKSKYETANKAMMSLVEKLIDEIPNFDSTVGAVDPKQSLFRIYRDVRFSASKEPYKTNMGCFIVKGGKSSGNAGYYLHLEPDNSFVGGGIHNPSPKRLKAIRDEIAYAGQDLIAIVEARNFQRHFQKISGDSLIRPPKGFEANSRYIDLLKMKSFTVFKPLDDVLLARENFIDHIVPIFKSMQVFNAFLNRAMNP